MAPQLYSKPPIVEAVIDFSFGEFFGSRDMERLRDRFKREYPSIHDQFAVQVKVENGSAQASSAERVGFRMSSKEGNDVLVIGSQNIVTSRLARYEGWNGLYQRAQKNLAICRKIIGNKRLSKVGLRYINRFDIDLVELKSGFIEDYVKVYTMPGNLIGFDLKGFNNVFEAIDPVTAFMIRVGSYSSQPVLIDHAAYILDIDVINMTPSLNFDLVEEQLEKMRELKNRIFEASITDKMRAAIR